MHHHCLSCGMPCPKDKWLWPYCNDCMIAYEKGR